MWAAIRSINPWRTVLDNNVIRRKRPDSRGASFLFESGSQSLRNPDAVHGGRGNASGIAGTLPAGENTPDGGLESEVPEDADRGGRTGLNAC
ncbi:hypothetical protein SDC9_196647 [bioreactor metagenome]|uniref:Uncharacterized protein n=1 Tax=bioreactor metagenome TaxID=1076179 RepID=A0A645IL39_9ZZZZ